MTKRIVISCFLVACLSLCGCGRKNNDFIYFPLLHDLTVFRTPVSDKGITCYILFTNSKGCLDINVKRNTTEQLFTFYIDPLNLYVEGIAYTIYESTYKPPFTTHLIPIRWFKKEPNSGIIEYNIPPLALLIDHDIEFPSVLKFKKLDKIFIPFIKNGKFDSIYYRIFETPWNDYPENSSRYEFLYFYDAISE